MKSLIKNLIPKPIFNQIRSWHYNQKRNAAKKAFNNSQTEPSFLDYSMLVNLHAKYQSNTHVSYDPDALLERGLERANMLMNKPGIRLNDIKTCLEVGCGDGMVSAALADKGKQVMALDFSSDMFDPRAGKAGVKFITGDAEVLPVADNSVDLVFSFNSFEHIMNPEKAFNECLRVLRPGGYLYVAFNPMFYSAMGFHAYKSTQVPFLQVLFTEKDIRKLVGEHNLPDVEFSYTALNKWCVSHFRQLWHKLENKMEFISYHEIPDYYGLELIENYPSCFKSKSTVFDDFLISGIELTAKKIT